MCQVAAMVLVLAAGTNVLLIRWLIGLLLGGTVASVGRMYLPADKLSFVDAYSYRATYLWWIGRPPAAEVEAAVRELAEGDVWPKLLRNLEAFHQQPETVEVLSVYSTRPNWFDHFIWRHALVALGGEALTHLLALARAKKHHLQPTATWLVQSIGHETATRLAGHADRLRCVDCLTSCGPHSIIRVFDVSMLYYGCRICGQSREFFYCPQGVVAVLDSTWPENQPQRGGLRHKTFSVADSPEIEEDTPDPGLLRVNWLARRGLFDFERVEIIQATDEDVERLAVQVGNDTDPIRQPHYAQMHCLIAPQCLLSENSLRVLRRTFGQVECGQEVREWVR
jgi:hypothetical protein